ncbi:MAG: GAF domain-containing protein [Anaerolineales bacterium]|nr:GAF domain-containing protein [Anaerolineales bacterium]
MTTEKSYQAYLQELESGHLEFGGTRMVMLDIRAGFWGLRRQIEALVGSRLTDSVLQQAGANGGASFARAFVGDDLSDPEGAFWDCLAAFQAAGFGQFEVETFNPGILDGDDRLDGLITVQARNNFEVWTADQNQDAGSPSCAYTAGVLVGFINIISGRQDIVCVEQTCRSQGDDICTFDLMRTEADTPVPHVSYSPDPGLTRQINLLELLFERMPMGIAILDPEYKIRRYNPTWDDFAQRYRPSGGEKLTPGINYFAHLPGTESTVKPLFDRVLAGETIREEDVPLNTPGETSYWDVVLAPIIEGEKVTGILNVTIDVTERFKSRKKLQETLEILQEREERLSLVLEGINDGVWDWNLLTDEVYFSSRWKQMLGYQQEELEDRFETWESLVHPDDLERTLQVIEEYLEGTRSVYYLEHRLRHRDGTYRWILARGKALRNEDGVPYRMVGSHTDITERKLAEKALKDSEENLRSLIENAKNFAVYQVRVQQDRSFGGEVIFVSPSLKDIFGIEDPFRFESWFEHLHPEDEERILEANLKAVKEGESYSESTRWYHPRREEWIWIHTASSPVYDERGELSHFNGLILDITDQKMAEEALRRKTRLDEMVARISTRFINLPPEKVDEGINQVLQETAEHLGLDRGYVFQYSSNKEMFNATHEWCRKGVEPQIDRMQNMSVEDLHWSNERLLEGKILIVPRVDDLPPEAADEKNEFRKQSIQSLISIPLVYQGETIGFVGFDAVFQEMAWTDDDLHTFKMLSAIIANALAHRRAQSIQKGQRQFLELLAKGSDFKQTLHTLIETIEGQWPGMLGLVLLLDVDGRHLQIGASTSLPQEYVESIEGLAIGPEVGSCGTACYSGERVIVEDIRKDSRWDGLRNLAVKHNLLACWSQPVFSPEGEVVGTFVMYYQHPRSPSKAELETIELGAHLVGIALERKNADQALRESQRRISTLISNLPGMAYRCKNEPSWPMEFVSEGSLELTGYRPEELVGGGEDTYGKLIREKDRGKVWKKVQEALDEHRSYQLSYRIMTPEGEKWVWEQGQGVYNDEGEVAALEGFVTDITERVMAQRNLEKRVEERTHELSTLLDISHNLASTLDLESLSEQILDQLGSVIEYQAASIMVKEGEKLKILAYKGPIDRERALSLDFPLDQSRANSEVIRQQKPIIIDDVLSDSSLAEAIRKTAGDELETTYSYLRCWMGVPLLVKDEVVGMLTLDSSRPGYYGEKDADLAMAFANQVAVAVDNARLFRAAQQRADESETLVSVQKAITSRLDPDTILQMIADEARRLTKTDISAVYLLDEDELEIAYVSGDVPPGVRGSRLKVSNSIAGRVVTRRESILVLDTWKDQRVDRSISDTVRARSLLIVPLITGEETVGTITVANHTPGGFSPEDERLLTTLASNVVISLENARLYQAEQERRQVAEGLRDILAVLNSDRPLEDILHQVNQQAVQLSSADAGAIYALVEDSSLIGVVSKYQMPENFSRYNSFPLSTAPAADAIIHGKPYAVEDFKDEEEQPAFVDEELYRVISQYFRASLTIPVLVKEEIFGAISLYFEGPRRFSEEEIRLASSFADQAALAIENANLRSRAEKTAVAEERNRLARDLHDAVTQTLFSASIIAEVLPRIWEKDQEAGKQRLNELKELTRGALAEMRTLLMELRPKAVLEAKFDELLEQLTSGFIGRTRTPIEYNLEVDGSLPDEVKVALYRILQESLNNIAKHARAESVFIHIKVRDEAAEMIIRDDGRGFNPAAVPVNSLGVDIMKERAGEINADLDIVSEIGQGTEVSVTWNRDEEKTNE